LYKVLIIDDEKPVRTVITALGKWDKFGIEKPPITAMNGAEGLSAMREIRPNIVFVDMQMPVMDGVSFLKSASQEFPDVKYIVVSGYDEFGYAQAAIKNGVVDYLLKPIAADELDEALHKAVTLLNLERNITMDKMVQSPADISPDEVIDIIKDYIEKNYCKEIKISMFSQKYYFSKEYLSKLFKKKHGFGIYEYALHLRMKRAKELLRGEDLQIQEISERLGYSNNNYFSKAFKNYYGQSPSEFRERERLS